MSGAENGGYTMENARSGLNLFLQKNRQPTDIDVSKIISDYFNYDDYSLL